MTKRGKFALAGLAIAGGIGAAAAALKPAPGHTLLHVDCSGGHAHGPLRTAGEGKRLLEARELNRRARMSHEQQP